MTYHVKQGLGFYGHVCEGITEGRVLAEIGQLSGFLSNDTGDALY